MYKIRKTSDTFVAYLELDQALKVVWDSFKLVYNASAHAVVPPGLVVTL